VAFLMARLLARLCSPFVNNECCGALLVDFDFGNQLCVSLVVSKAIGFGRTLGVQTGTTTQLDAFY
jgi:hypothetical protein